MTARPRRAAALWATAVAVVGGVAAPAARATSGLPAGCAAVRTSPAFARDGVAVCTALDRSGAGAAVLARVHVTSDGGRSWHRAAASGLVLDGSSPFPFAARFSPAYAQDRRIFLPTDAGLFVTTDLGRTFTALSPLVKAAHAGDPVVYQAPFADGSWHVHAATARHERTLRYDADLALHEPRPMPGAVAFAALPSGKIVFRVVAEQRPGADQPVRLVHHVDACSAELVCSERRASFPLGATAPRIWLASGHDPRVPAYVWFSLESPDHRRHQLWRSTDGGHRFERWQVFERLLAAATGRGGALPDFDLAADPSRPARVYARVVAPADAAVPREQLLRSDNGGASWQLVGFRRDVSQPGARGTLPWAAPARVLGGEPADVEVAADGRLFTSGSVLDESGVVTATSTFCSRDGGRSWAARCR